MRWLGWLAGWMWIGWRGLKERRSPRGQEQAEKTGRSDSDEARECNAARGLCWCRRQGGAQRGRGRRGEGTGGCGGNELAELVTRREFAFTLRHKEGGREERTTRKQLMGTTVAIQVKLLLVGSRCSYDSGCEVGCRPK